MIRSKALRSTIRSLITGKAAARQGSMVSSSPSRKLRMWSWHEVVVLVRGPCGAPLTTTPHWPQIPSRQSWSKAIGSSPFDQALVDDVEHLQERHVGLIPGAS